ncbi:MAG: hypothetical protein M1831_002486 [Alyxoria varia]|nr:MAG: hypothetical protein M1831_002486 [Alyxoria varia]
MAHKSKFVGSRTLQDGGASKQGLGPTPDLRHFQTPIDQTKAPKMIMKAKGTRDDVMKYDPNGSKTVKDVAITGVSTGAGALQGGEVAFEHRKLQSTIDGYRSGLYSVTSLDNKQVNGQVVEYSLTQTSSTQQTTEAQLHELGTHGQGKIGFVVKSLALPKTRTGSLFPQKNFGEPFRLLDLPEELILDIFEYVFDGALIYMDEMDRFCLPSTNLRPVCSVRRNADCGGGTALFPIMMTGIFQPGGRTVCINGKEMAYITPQTPTKSRNTGLMLSCKAGASLLSRIMHKRSIFGFSSPKHIEKYLSQQKEVGVYPKNRYGLPRPEWLPLNSGNIKRLCLQIRDYGEPELQSYREYRIKYYNSWTKACNMIVGKLPNLESISIDAHVPIMMNNEASIMTLEAIWAQPILAFGRAENINAAAVALSMVKYSRRIAFEMANAFSEVLQRKLLKFDDASALEAITFFKDAAIESQKRASNKTKAFVKEQWEFMEKCNGIVTDGMQKG